MIAGNIFSIHLNIQFLINIFYILCVFADHTIHSVSQTLFTKLPVKVTPFGNTARANWHARESVNLAQTVNHSYFASLFYKMVGNNIICTYYEDMISSYSAAQTEPENIGIL